MRPSAVIAAPVFVFAAWFTLHASGNVDRGQALFTKMCTGCHDLDHEKSGPRLRNVFGRRAGTVPNFPYSEGLKSAGVVWDEATLDKWLSDPSTVVHDNDMAFRLENAGQREDIIAYLKKVGGK